jgi:type IV pilus assembly protein PilQ
MAEADKKQAEAARTESERMLKDAKAQLATLEKKQQDAQALEDRARAANAAAQAREEAARDAAAQAAHERELAEAAVKQAKDARDRAAATDRSKLASDAQAAEERLAKARAATEAAEAQRAAAEQAALAAKQDLEHTRSALAGVEQQRSAAVAAATEAARKRSEAEAAASDAARRRTEAEAAARIAAKQKTEAEAAARIAAKQRSDAEHAAALASKQKNDAEAQRIAAVEAAKAAKAAADAADKQRMVAEHAAGKALAAKRDAEGALAQLTTKRQAAERAAAEVEARSKAEAKAQAEVAAAQARKAGDAQIAAARAEVERLTTERKRAEAELADRRKAVAAQQAETTRLATAAAQARDAADREEARKAKLADERAHEEQELAKLEAEKQAKAKAQQVAAQLAAKISNVTFSGDRGTGHVELAAMGDTAVQLGQVTPTTVEVIVDHAELAPRLERTLDVSKFGSPVKRVSSYRDRKVPGRVRVVAELSRPASPTVEHDATGVHLHFVANDIAKHMPRTQNLPAPVIGGFGAVSTPVAQQSVSQVPPGPGAKKHIYHGATVDFDFKDAPIHDLLRILADTGHVNIVVPDTIDAKVTVRLKRVPWDQALEVILASHGLWYRREGNLYRIATRKEIDTEDQEEAARREAAVKAEAPAPQVITLNYANAGELKAKFEGMLSPKGHIEVDERTNSLIVNDIAGNREQIRALARGLDTQTPQITIEARIVEARSTFVRQFGVQWGGRALAGAAGGNATGLVWPSSIGIQGGNVDAQTISTGVAQPSDFAVNLPAAVGTGEGGALGISLGSVGGNFNINLRLSALEDEGTVRIISAPKITVLNNKEAKISQGVSIPISVVSAAGTNTQFVQADLALTVTPYVSQQDCAIAMNLVVTKNEPDFVNVGARGDPTILRKEARTQMLVNDGETTVLGGIYTRNTGLAYKKIPFLGDLPVLGWLFKNRRENDDRTEILVFITPKITNKASLRCTQ